MKISAPLSSDLTKRDLAFLFLKRKWQITGAFVATLLMVTVSTYLTPRSYEATATVYMVRNLPPIAATAPSTFSMILDRKEVLNSEVDLITSRRVAEKVAERLDSSASASEAGSAAARSSTGGLLQLFRDKARGAIITIGLTDPPASPLEARVDALRSGIRATPAVNSDFITLSYRDENRQYAAMVVNAFVDVYVGERLMLFKRPGVQEFYDEQIDRAQRVVDEVDVRMTELKVRSGVVAPQDQLKLKLEELSALSAELNHVRGESGELRERVAALRQLVENEPESVMSTRLVQRNPNITELDKKRLELESQKALELNRFQPGSPQISEIDLSIQRIRAAMAVEPLTVVNSESLTQNTLRTTLLTDLHRADVDYTATRAREQALAGQIEVLKAEVGSLDANAAALQRLSAVAESAIKVRTRYIEQQEEARIASATDPGVTNVQIVSRATPPSRPLYPRMMMISLGAFLGLFVGVAFAFVSELFAQTLDRREDVERELGVPLLASMPDLGRSYRKFT